MDKKLIGVDLGGTNMRAGLVYDGIIEKVFASPVPVTENWKEVMDQLIEVISNVFSTEVEGIGIGVPGVVDSKTGVVYDIQNIPSWKEVAVGTILSDHFKVPVFVNNDANCFAVGERFYGAGKEFDDFVGLITGTGLGAGIIKWGHLLPDQNCGAGEFGMIPYLEENYEFYCSGQFFKNKAGLDGAEVARRADSGDEQALNLFAEYGKHLANAIKSIIFAIDPAAIIIGGSVSKSFSYYEKAMKKELATFPYSGVVEKLVIKPSQMPEIAILGAAALNFNKQQLIENNYKYA
ncbi:ROK family protein [Natronoflexus pectinivorans]|uniref:Glucokinase n=1 Tax=Natronoflexus pectinivorans TaxID=682526 RepID=A0A4R2GDD2_9BACT|nr:ROK family protein [Natronoflexus pectinivorans]TCO06095.1 glucokinase [Natronoflexus pectinivorans]